MGLAILVYGIILYLAVCAPRGPARIMMVMALIGASFGMIYAIRLGGKIPIINAALVVGGAILFVYVPMRFLGR